MNIDINYRPLFETEKKRTLSLKWEYDNNENKLPFWVADMDFPIAPPIVKEIKNTINDGMFGGYSMLPEELSSAICQNMKKKTNWDIKNEDLIIRVSTIPFLNMICRTFAPNGGKVLVPLPVYYHIFNAPDWGGQSTIRFNLTLKDNRYYFDFEKLELEFKNNVKIIILCNPHNPGGRVWNKNELITLAKLCEKYDVLICSDDIHFDLVLSDDTKYNPIASISPEIMDRTITLVSPSKTYNIPNFGATYCIVSNPILREKLKTAINGVLTFPSLLGIKATITALTKCEQWHHQLLEYLRENRIIIYDFFSDKPQFEMMWPQEATYLAWVRVNHIDPLKIGERFLSAGLKVSDGIIYEGKGYFRFNFACPKSRLYKGLDLIKQNLL